MVKTIQNKIEMKDWAEDFAKTLVAGDIVVLSGDLGAGKTYVVKCMAKILGIKDDVISPTFNIIKTYKINYNKAKKFNHFDVYRLKNTSELIDIGFYECINETDTINVIEWGDLIKKEIPTKSKWINIKVLEGEKRKVSVKI